MGPVLSGVSPLEPLDVLALALSEPADGESKIERVFEWQLERSTLVWLLGIPVVAASLLAIVFSSGLEDWQVGVLGGAALVGAALGAVAIRIRAHVLQRRYLAAVELYGLLRQLL
jgi:hypothetical protein